MVEESCGRSESVIHGNAIRARTPREGWASQRRERHYEEHETKARTYTLWGRDLRCTGREAANDAT